MKFSKVKLQGGGLHGLEGHYTLFEEKDNFQFENEFVRKRKAPVPTELKNAFKKLRHHLAAICGLAIYVEDEIEITGVSSDADNQFLIMGKVRALETLFYAINTPLVKSEHGYSHFDEVIEIVKDIYKLSRTYFKEKLMADHKQIAMDLFDKDPDAVNKVVNKDLPEGEEGRTLTAADIEAMADGELQPILIAALERKGCIVMKQEEHVTGADVSDAENFGDEPERKKMSVA